MATIWEWIKANLLSSLMGILVAVYIIAWALNAVIKTQFDLPQLLELAKYVLGKFGIDSALNTAFQSNAPKEVCKNGTDPA